MVERGIETATGRRKASSNGNADRTDANAMFRQIERQMLTPYRVEFSQEHSPPAHAVA